MDAIQLNAATASGGRAVSAAPQPGWRAQLELEFERADARTRLAGRRHRGPLLVQRPFYPEPAPAPAVGGERASGAAAAHPCHLYLLHPPGGLVGGDELHLKVRVGPGAHALLTTAAAGKVYRRRDRETRILQTLQVDDGRLEWLPQENIFYPDAAAELCTTVRLAGAARFIGWEINCLGLPALQRGLDSGSLRQRWQLWQQERLLWNERSHFGPAGLQARWGLAHSQVAGTWLAWPADAGLLAVAREIAASWQSGAEAEPGERTLLGCSLVDGVLCCRGLAGRADRLRAAFTQLWQCLRPLLLGRPAVAPRIWST